MLSCTNIKSVVAAAGEEEEEEERMEDAELYYNITSVVAAAGEEEEEEERMQDAELYASSNQMQRRDASIVLAAHLPVMSWKEGFAYKWNP